MAEQAKVVMYSRMFCAYCAAARKLLEAKSIDYEDIDMSMNSALRREIRDQTGRHTVPQIFIGERHVGGYDDLAALDESGDLDIWLAGGGDDAH